MALSDSHKADLLLVFVTLLAAVSWAFSNEAVLLMPKVKGVLEPSFEPVLAVVGSSDEG